MDSALPPKSKYIRRKDAGAGCLVVAMVVVVVVMVLCVCVVVGVDEYYCHAVVCSRAANG